MTHDFSIVLDLSEPGDYLRVLADCSMEGQASHSLAVADLKELHASQIRVAEQGAQAPRSAAVDAGTALFEALMGGEVRVIFERACQSAWKSGAVLRLVLKMDPSSLPSWVHAVYWELMYDPERAQFLAIDSDVLLVRSLLQPNPVRSFPAGLALRTLVTSACPAYSTCAPLPRLVREMDELEQLFQHPPMTHRVRGKFHRGIGFNGLQADLVEAERRDQPFHAWHHCGHGRFDVENGYQLAFEPGRPGTASEGPWIGLPALKKALSYCPNLRLVFLNVCLGASPDALGSLLAGLGVPAVIGHAFSVDDRAAARFAREFWRAFGAMRVDEAVQRARLTLAGGADPLAFAHAVLFLRALDPIPPPAAVAQH